MKQNCFCWQRYISVKLVEYHLIYRHFVALLYNRLSWGSHSWGSRKCMFYMTTSLTTRGEMLIQHWSACSCAVDLRWTGLLFHRFWLKWFFLKFKQKCSNKRSITLPVARNNNFHPIGSGLCVERSPWRVIHIFLGHFSNSKFDLPVHFNGKRPRRVKKKYVKYLLFFRHNII
jgi:hypothetical protein